MLKYFKNLCLNNINNIDIYQYKNNSYLSNYKKLEYLNMLVFNLKKDYYKYVFNIDIDKKTINIDIYQIKTNKFNTINKNNKIMLSIELNLKNLDHMIFINILKDLKDIELTNNNTFDKNFNYNIIYINKAVLSYE